MDVEKVILKALAKYSGVVKTREELATKIATYLEITAENEAENSQTDTRPVEPKMYTGLLRNDTLDQVASELQALKETFSEKAFQPEDYPEFPSNFKRVKKQDAQKGIVEYRSIDDILEYVNEYAPKSLSITIPGGKEPLALFKKVKREDNYKCVRLSYAPVGEDDPPTVMFYTYDEKIGLQEKMKEVLDAATARYTAIAKKIPVVIPPPPTPGVFFGEQGHDEGEMDQSSLSRAADLAASWKQGRPEQFR